MQRGRHDDRADDIAGNEEFETEQNRPTQILPVKPVTLARGFRPLAEKPSGGDERTEDNNQHARAINGDANDFDDVAEMFHGLNVEKRNYSLTMFVLADTFDVVHCESSLGTVMCSQDDRVAAGIFEKISMQRLAFRGHRAVSGDRREHNQQQQRKRSAAHETDAHAERLSERSD